VASAFLTSEICELEPRSASLTRSLLERMKGKEGEGRGKLNCLLPSFSGPHTGLSHQGQRPKRVEDTILQILSSHSLSSSGERQLLSLAVRVKLFLCVK
jgi:hypothetical protein